MSKREKEKTTAEKIAESFSDSDSSKFDPDGSWTGTPRDKNDKPIQDADDL